MMKLELATVEDNDKLLSLSREQMQPYYEQYSLNWNEAERIAFLEESTLFRILDPEICGYLQLCEKADEMFIYDLQIYPDHQGKGTGSKVINRVYEMARDQGLKAVRLGTFKTNPASELYKRLGFYIIKENDYFAWHRNEIT